MKTITILSAALVLGAMVPARAADYSFSIDGDLSPDRLAPTAITLAAGDNRVRGWVQNTHRDYFTVEVPEGAVLARMWFEEFTSENTRGFIAFQAGDTFTVSPAQAQMSDLLGGTHFGEQAYGLGPAASDMLVELQSSSGAGAIGFTRPLPAGEYTFWVNQTEPESIFYQFNFVVVPEPSSLAVVGAGMILLARRRRGGGVR